MDFPCTSAELPAQPTEANPGSEAKIAVMAERYRERRQLFHPDDGGTALLRKRGQKPEGG